MDNDNHSITRPCPRCGSPVTPMIALHELRSDVDSSPQSLGCEWGCFGTDSVPATQLPTLISDWNAGLAEYQMLIKFEA